MRLASQAVIRMPVRPMPRLRAAVPYVRVRRGMGTTYGGPCNWSDDYCNSSASLANPLSWPCCLWVDAANLASSSRGLVSNVLTPTPVLNLRPPVTQAPPTADQLAPGDPTLPAQLSAAAWAQTQQQMSGDVNAASAASDCSGLLSSFDPSCASQGVGLWLLGALAVLVGVEVLGKGGRR